MAVDLSMPVPVVGDYQTMIGIHFFDPASGFPTTPAAGDYLETWRAVRRDDALKPDPIP